MTVSGIEILSKDLEYLSAEDIFFDFIQNRIYFCRTSIIGFDSVLLDKLKILFRGKAIVLNSSISESSTLTEYMQKHFFSYMKFISRIQEDDTLAFLDTMPKYFLFAILNELNAENDFIIINTVGISYDSLKIILTQFFPAFNGKKTFILLEYTADPNFKFIELDCAEKIRELNLDICQYSSIQILKKLVSVKYRSGDSLKKRITKALDFFFSFIRHTLYLFK